MRVIQYTWSVTLQVVKLVTVHERLWWPATVCQFMTCRRSSVVLHTIYECLWHHYFRTRNIVTLLSAVYLCCLRIVTGSPLLANRYRSGVLDRYVIISQWKCSTTYNAWNKWLFSHLRWPTSSLFIYFSVKTSKLANFLLLVNG